MGPSFFFFDPKLDAARHEKKEKKIRAYHCVRRERRRIASEVTKVSFFCFVTFYAEEAAAARLKLP